MPSKAEGGGGGASRKEPVKSLSCRDPQDGETQIQIPLAFELVSLKGKPNTFPKVEVLEL